MQSRCVSQAARQREKNSQDRNQVNKTAYASRVSRPMGVAISHSCDFCIHYTSPV